jgi:peptidoglycan/LPS O-acetylase OafA/YrhL
MRLPVSSRHIATLDGLRGVAAIAVLFCHIDNKILNDLIWPPYASLAVDFFFMLSGFVVARSYETRLLQGLSVSTFAGIRLRRLYPLIFLGVVLGAVTLAMRVVLKKDLDLRDVMLASFFAFFLIPRQIEGRPDSLYPANTPHWSLFFELAINMVYASLIKYLNTGVLCAVCLASFAGLVYALPASGYYLIEFGLISPTFALGILRVTFPFTLGVLLYRFQRSPKPLGRDISPFLCGFLFIILLTPWLPRAWYFEILIVSLVFPLLLVAGIRCPSSAKTQGMHRWLGELSYPLYATHEPIVRLCVNAARVLGWEDRPIIVGIVCFFTAIAFAFVAYVFWDRPVREWLKRQELQVANA